MSALDRPSAREQLRVADREHWQEGPPHALFEDLRSRCPVHFTDGFTDYPSEAGFWSVTTADDVREVSRDWQTYSSASGITAAGDVVMPLALRGPASLRRHPDDRAPGVRRRRAALLPRDGACAPGAEGALRGDARAVSGSRARRPAGPRRVAVRQPAQDAARPPAALTAR